MCRVRWVSQVTSGGNIPDFRGWGSRSPVIIPRPTHSPTCCITHRCLGATAVAVVVGAAPVTTVEAAAAGVTLVNKVHS